ncbi:TrmH family RNA methyltransferase [Bacillaceae bacterium W0354]
MIESRQNQQVKAWKKLHKKKYREQEHQFLVEGWHLVEEAIQSNWEVDIIILEQNIELPFEYQHINHIYVSTDVFNELTQTETPQGIIAVVHQKKWDQSDPKRLLLLDAVQDPGNVGTIIRSALAFNVDAIVLGKGSADLFNDKVIRSTQGALFHLPIFRDEVAKWVDYCREKDITTYATALDKNAVPLNEIKDVKSFAIIVGNEGQGISSEILNMADETVYIPIADQSESLNVGVATSIALYHFHHVT